MTSSTAPLSSTLHVFLTGGTGLIGSGVLRALLEEGHRVSALARSDEAAARLAGAGAVPVRGDLTDTALLAEASRHADAVVHCGSPGGDTKVQVDVGVVDTVLHALAGTGKTFVHTSGVWTYGSGDLDERTPQDPQAPGGWRIPQDDRVRAAAERGVRGVVVAPGIVYGDGRGLPALVASAPRDEDGRLLAVGSGEQRWTTIHTADLGRLYAAALARATPGSFHLGVSGQNPRLHDLAVAADRGAGGAGLVRRSTVEETTSWLGDLAGPFLLDQAASGTRARRELGWRPVERSLADELASGAYTPAPRVR